MTARVAITFSIFVAVVGQMVAAGDLESRAADVQLLKFPYPYRAAATVCSDIDEASVETFEAVHTLVNTGEHIERGSDIWQRLFEDPEIEQREQWRNGMDGFGLPIADTLFLYAPRIGAFEAFDYATGQPVPQTFEGRDLRDIISGWLQRGWVDSLHTPGQGHITREATVAAFQWLGNQDHPCPKVWLNHSVPSTPSSIAPDEMGQGGLFVVVKNVIKLGTMAMCKMGLESLARKIAVQPYPTPFPRGQRVYCWVLAVLLVGSALWIFLCLALRRLRRLRNLIAGVVILAVAAAVLHTVPLRYSQGDNPTTAYYNADIARRHGFRYFWLQVPVPGCAAHVPNTLGLPERSWNGRRSCLHVADLDDGSSCLIFGRNCKGAGGFQSLRLFSKEALENLCDRQGTSIIYTHWTDRYKCTDVFDAEALDGLAWLKRFYEAGRVWVAPTSEILDFIFARTFLEYEAELHDGVRVINIGRIDDPVGEPLTPTLRDLAGISFDCPSGSAVEVWLGENRLDPEVLDFLDNGERIVVRFPLALRSEQPDKPGQDN